MLHHTGQRTQHTADWAIGAPVKILDFCLYIKSSWIFFHFLYLSPHDKAAEKWWLKWKATLVLLTVSPLTFSFIYYFCAVIYFCLPFKILNLYICDTFYCLDYTYSWFRVAVLFISADSGVRCISISANCNEFHLLLRNILFLFQKQI